MHYSINFFCLLIFVVIIESIPNYYEILKVSKDASTRDIKTAYKRLMLRYHPDKNKDNPVALEYSKKINEACRILCDEKNRMEYDKKLNKSSGSPTTSEESSPSSSGSPTTSGESSPSSSGSSTTSGESSTSSEGSYPTFAGSSPKRKKAHTDFGSSSKGKSSTFSFNFDSRFFPNFFGGSSSGFTNSTSNGSSKGSHIGGIKLIINDLKIVVFSNKIRVQNKNEVYETNYLEIKGAANRLKIYGNNIQIENVKKDHKKIIAKSVKIDIKGEHINVNPTKIEYKFSEDLKKLKPTGNITGINGTINTVEVRFYKMHRKI
ncbi:unnamed protein product [Meloidogyne enterolobii]|uniref:Uncharacterized protein n=1 Tax=Meloidogyne enterolobii TaxID=390850 RepID=A0ACB1AHB9_MELEN